MVEEEEESSRDRKSHLKTHLSTESAPPIPKDDKDEEIQHRDNMSVYSDDEDEMRLTTDTDLTRITELKKKAAAKKALRAKLVAKQSLRN